MSTTTTINCPNCGHEIDINEALSHEAEERIEQQYNERLARARKDLEKQQTQALEQARQTERELISAQMKNMQDELSAKNDALRKAQADEVALLKAQRALKDLQERQSIEIEKAVLASRSDVEQQVRRTEQERAELQIREMQHKLDQANKVADDLKRKMEQGSQQLSGEILELAIEDFLRAEFPGDDVAEIKKGQRGGDCIHTIMSDGKPLGKIYYESKRTKAFQSSWVDKLKEDMREKGVDVGVIVTETMPKDMDRFGQRSGVWICSFSEFKALSHVLRELVQRVGFATASQQHRGDKMSMLYDYMTSAEFRMQVDAIVNGFQSMQDDLARERTAMERIWKQREKQIQTVLNSLAGLYGSVKGIAGGDVGDLGSLELGDTDETR